MKTVGVAILTLNAERHLAHCLLPLLKSPLKPRIVVIDSASTDDTFGVAKRFGIEVLRIERDDFNHGETRERARRHLGTDIVVMITPDAYAIDAHALGHLVQPLIQEKASLAYGRQLPHKEARFFEAFPREFNYPAESHIRSIEEIDKYGVYTFFCSDSFAAYSNRALDEIGGFSTVLLGEDTLAAAKLLRKGHKIAYVAEAQVHHSHAYTLRQEFQRHFDTGIARREYGEWLKCAGGDRRRGSAYVSTMFKQLVWKPHLLPYAFLQTLMKWIGYSIGQWSGYLPRWLKKMLSSQKFYWSSNPYMRGKRPRIRVFKSESRNKRGR